MRKYYCQCGNQVFFESSHCVACDSQLGFEPESLSMLTLTNVDGYLLRSADQREFHRCDNGLAYDVCNWLRPATSEHTLCFACQFNRTVPNQSLPENQQRWKRLEEGKKRLFFTLLQLGLPLVDGWSDPEKGLLLDFIEDARAHKGYAETFAKTGYLGGVITINTLEADEVARVIAKLELNEAYRTVLGHLRHESGHYFWARLDPDQQLCQSFRDHFGDDSRNYQDALEYYYSNGPSSYWREHYISAYASSHPVEDWAETWGHYLHIYDALETAAAHELIKVGPEQMTMPERISCWRQLSITLNELNRSIGRQDAYPFVINSMVENKLVFVDQVIDRLRAQG